MMKPEIASCSLSAAQMAEQAGVTFRFNTPVEKLLYEGEQIYGVKCGDDIIKADAYVMAFGSYSTAMLKGIVDIPVYPLKGYSLTIPVAQDDGAPVSTILDETYKIAITRFDKRIRVGEWRKLSALTLNYYNRVVKRWRWSYAISSRAEGMWNKPRSGMGCGQ